MPGIGRSKAWWKIYESLRASGKSKESAAKIASAQYEKMKRKMRGRG